MAPTAGNNCTGGCAIATFFPGAGVYGGLTFDSEGTAGGKASFADTSEKDPLSMSAPSLKRALLTGTDGPLGELDATSRGREEQYFAPRLGVEHSRARDMGSIPSARHPGTNSMPAGRRCWHLACR